MLLQRWSRFSLLFYLFYFTVYSHWALNNLFLFIFIILYYLFLVFEVKIVIIGTRNISQNTLQNDSKYYTEGAFTLCIYELECLLSGLTRLLEKKKASLLLIRPSSKFFFFF